MAITISTVAKLVRYVDYNTPLVGATELTVAITVQTGATLNTGHIFSKWSPFAFGQSFTVLGLNTGEVALYILGTGGSHARVTTNTPVTINSTNRIVARWSAAEGMSIQVNEVDCPLAISEGKNDAVSALASTVSTEVSIGGLNLGGNAYIGLYSEAGIWTRRLTDDEALAIANPDPLVGPLAPITYDDDMFFYAPLCMYDDSVYPPPTLKNLIDDVTPTLFTLDAGGFNHPYVVYPESSPYALDFCTVSNPLQEVEPEVGQSFGPLVWVEWAGSDDTMRIWAPVDLPDPDTYYHGYKTPWLLSAGKVVRALSDEQGEYQGQTFDVTVNDTSRDIRSLLGQTDDRRHLLNTRGVMRMISQADWRMKLTPRTVAIGKLRSYRLH